MSYKSLEIWKLASQVANDIHIMTLTELPGYEKHEQGSQIRRSSKSVRSNIVEGYGRRTYKADFLRFLVIAHASNDETVDHLESLFNPASLVNETKYHDLHQKVTLLGKKLNRFIQTVRISHNT